MKRIVSLLVVCVLAAACVPLSLHPLYTDEDLVFEPDLLGEWAEKDAKETWLFTEGKEKSYDFWFTDEDGKRGAFIAHLVNVEGSLFIDIFPKEPEEEAADEYRWHLVGMHSFIHVKQIHPTLQMALLDLDWLKKFLYQHPEEIRHERVDDKIILTAKPKELQAFLIQCQNIEGSFGDYSDMTRKEEDPRAGDTGQSAGRPTEAR